jgi:hypothetical protein
MIAALIPALLPLLKDLFERTIPDPAERDKQMQALLAQLMQADNSQTAVNVEQAKSGNWFVAGGRPFIMWICGAALAWQFVILPIAMWASYALGHPFPKPTDLDPHLWELLSGMLGLGAMRTYEKIRGVAK